MSRERRGETDFEARIRQTLVIGLQEAELIGPGGTQRIHDWADWIITEYQKEAEAKAGGGA